MEGIDRVVEIDEKIFITFKSFMERFHEISNSFPSPKVLASFMHFITGTNFIKEGIIELAYSDNTYALNILYRSLIEQFLKFQFIWMKYGETKDDSIGTDYWEYYSFSEEIDYAKAWNKVSSIINHNPEKDPIEIIKEANPHFQDLSNKDLQYKISQFNYRNIVKFIVERINKNSVPMSSFLLKIIPEYSELSSFVHGGPNTQMHMQRLVDEEVRAKELINQIELSVYIANAVKLLTYFTIYQYDKSVGIHFNETNELIKQI